VDLSAEPRCAERWPGFYAYPHAEHTYQALALAFPAALDWSLATLERVLRRLRADAPAVAAAE
jgi:hypothetical protein